MADASERMRRFLVIASRDERLRTSHLVIYLALCIRQAESEDKKTFWISRRKIMQSCKIRGIATYHKCIRELISFGYVRYTPSYHPAKGSLVELSEFSSLLY